MQTALSMPPQHVLLQQLMLQRGLSAFDLAKAFDPIDELEWLHWAEKVIAGKERLGWIQIKKLQKDWQLSDKEIFPFALENGQIMPPMPNDIGIKLILHAATDQSLPDWMKRVISGSLEDVIGLLMSHYMDSSPDASFT